MGSEILPPASFLKQSKLHFNGTLSTTQKTKKINFKRIEQRLREKREKNLAIHSQHEPRGNQAALFNPDEISQQDKGGPSKTAAIVAS